MPTLSLIIIILYGLVVLADLTACAIYGEFGRDEGEKARRHAGRCVLNVVCALFWPIILAVAIACMLVSANPWSE